MTIATIVVVLILGFIAELVVLALANPGHFLGEWGPNEGRNVGEVKVLADRALTLAGFSGTSMALLIGQAPSHPQLQDATILVGLALVFFLGAFKLEVVGSTRRAFYQAQNRAFGYGLLSLVVALSIGYSAISPSLPGFFFLLPGVVIGWHLLELGYDIIDYDWKYRSSRSTLEQRPP